jgi:hypothetical protein
VDYSVIPNVFQAGLQPSAVADPLGALNPRNQGDLLTYDPKKDSLGAMNNQGKLIVIDTVTDPIGALKSPFGGFPRSPDVINTERMGDKMRNAFALASQHDHVSVEVARSKKLVAL